MTVGAIPGVECNVIINVVRVFDFVNNRQLHLYKKYIRNRELPIPISQNQRTMVLAPLQNLKELLVFMQELCRDFDFSISW